MEAIQTKKLLEKWGKEYPTACKILVDSLEALDKQIGNEYIPIDMLVEFHQAIANDVLAEAQSDENNEMVQIRFDGLNLLMKFYWAGKEYIKYNDEHLGASFNCRCVETKAEHKFKPDDVCLIPAYAAQHQRTL